MRHYKHKVGKGLCESTQGDGNSCLLSFIFAFRDCSNNLVIEDLAILFTHHNTDHPVVHEQSATSVDNYSHTSGISLVARVEEIMSNVYICNICLKQLELESVWSEDGGEGEVEFAVCETVVRNFGQWHSLHPRELLGESRNREHTSCQDIVESLLRMEQGIYVIESWRAESNGPARMSEGLGRLKGHCGASRRSCLQASI